MKKIFISLCLAALCGLGAQAQENTLMRVLQNNGKAQYLPISQIEKVDFVETQPWEDPTPGKNTFEDYVDIQVTRCERIASVLILEFSLTNRTTQDLDLTFNMYGIKSEDDLNKSYTYTTQIALGKQGYTDKHTFALDGMDTKKGKIRIKGFDTTNKAERVKIYPEVSIAGEKLDAGTILIKSNVTDNRKLRNTVQTCDKNIDFAVTGCERVGNVLIMNYKVTNTGTVNIGDFRFKTYGITSTDDLNNTYTYNTQVAIGKSKYGDEKSVFLEAGGTINGAFRVKSMESTNSAETMSIYPEISSGDYILEDYVARFIKIPITDNRVKSRGIRTCDRNLDFKFVSFTREGGNGYIDFTITNNGSIDITDFGMGTYGITCKDDLNNSYTYKTKCSFGNSPYADDRSVYIAAGETVTGHIKIEGFNANASYVTLSPKVSSSDYILDDPDCVYFLQIPTE